jgi:acetyl esterase/lipase
MMDSNRLRSVWVLVILLAVAPQARGGDKVSDRESWAATLFSRYSVRTDIPYLVADNWESKLDVYRPRQASSPTPTVVYFHGGGWVGGNKNVRPLYFLPYLEMGWSVVNVAYRLARVSLAPAAVEDTRCALRWVIENADRYNFDTDRIVLTGRSAGGHLSLITGMLPASSSLDRRCLGETELKVAAIVNWFGITDVDDLLEGENMQAYAVTWLGSQGDRHEIAKRVSPMSYIRPGLPPVLTIHGDADVVVPYEHAVRLHRALNESGVPNELVTISGGKHGGFSRAERLRIHVATREFLKKYGFRRQDHAPPSAE